MMIIGHRHLGNGSCVVYYSIRGKERDITCNRDIRAWRTKRQRQGRVKPRLRFRFEEEG